MQKNKILIYRTEQIGDFILSIPAFIEIRNKFSNYEITLVVKKVNYELAKRLNLFDKIIVYDDPFSERNFNKFNLILKPSYTIKTIKNLLLLLINKFDIFIEFSGRPYNILRSKVVNAKKIILADKKNQEDFEEVSRIFKTLNPLDIYPKKSYEIINLNKEEIKKTSDIIKKGYKSIILHAYTPLEEKNWDLQKFKKVLEYYYSKNVLFYLIGSKNDSEKLSDLKLKNVIDLTGKLSIEESYSLMKNSNLFIGLDSAPLHLAKFAKIPIIALFGKTNKKRWGPNKTSDIVLKNDNINDISVEEVIKSINGKLNE